MSTYHHGDLRAALLSAGESVLAERGLQGFTLRECARRAGVSHAAPKHHFQDVSGFLTAIAARGFDYLARSLREHLARLGAGASLVDEFHAVVCAYLAFAQDWPEHFRIMFRSDLLRDDAEDLAGSSINTFRELTNVVLRQRGEAELAESASPDSSDNLPLLHDIVIAWSHVHGFAHLRLEGQLHLMCEETEAAVIWRVSQRLSELIQQRDDYADGYRTP